MSNLKTPPVNGTGGLDSVKSYKLTLKFVIDGRTSKIESKIVNSENKLFVIAQT